SQLMMMDNYPVGSSAMLPSLIASPNYYDSSVACVLSNGVVAFAARQNVIYLGRELPDSPLAYLGFLPAHQVKCSGLAAIDDASAELEEGELTTQSVKFASCGLDGFVRVWDFAARSCLREFNPQSLGLKEPLPSCLAAADAAGGDAAVRLLAVGCESGHVAVLRWLPGGGGANGVQCRPFGKDQGVNQVLWKPNSASTLACAGRNGQVCVLSFNPTASASSGLTVAHRLAAHTGEVVNLAWNWDAQPAGDAQPDLASVGRDRLLKLWGLDSDESVVCSASVKVPPSLGKKRGWAQSDDRRYWCSLAWPRGQPLLFNTPTGEILKRDPGASAGYSALLTGSSAAKPPLHRMIFAMASRGNRLYTFGIDWWICELSLEPSPATLLSSVPTASGFALCAQPSPSSPATLAAGFGDGCIRVWRRGAGAASAYDVSLHWQGISGRVSAVTWHPSQEGLLAFGTDAGQVGCVDTLLAAGPAGGAKAVRLSPSHHKGCVYIVRWGPPPPSTTDSPEQASAAAVYSVGNYRILVHDPAMSQPATDVSRQLPAGPPLLHQQQQQQAGGPKNRNRSRTDAQFSPDCSQLAVGNESGLVEIFNWSAMRLRVRALFSRKIVNALAWHPGYAADCRGWLAIGTNSPTVFVMDTGVGSDSASCVDVSEPMITLKGHRDRITSLCWSPHTPHHLLSGSFDGTAQVWDVRTGDHLANFAGHAGKVYTVLWSASDPDVCLSGSEDHCLLVWRISQLDRKSPPTSGRQYRPPLPHGVLARTADEAALDADVDDASTGHEAAAAATAATLNTSVEDLELDDLLRLVKQKKRELTVKGQPPPAAAPTQFVRRPSATEKEPAASASAVPADNEDLADAAGPATLADVALRRGVGADPSRRRPALFPRSGRAENARAAASAEDLRLADFAALLALLRGDAEVEMPDNLLALLPRPHAARLADRELRRLLRIGHLDNYLLLLVWSGRLQRAVQEATASGFLPDWLVAVSYLAAAASPDLDASVAVAKADGLRRCGDAHLAATYLLAARRTEAAVDCLLTAGKAREAVLLSNLRLLPSDPVRARALDAYAKSCAEAGRHELRAQLLLLLQRPGEAVEALLQRRGNSAYLAAMQVWLAHDDLPAALGIGLDWLCSGLLDTGEAGTWRRQLRRLCGDRRHLCLEALLDTFDRLQARVRVNWKQFASDVAAAYGSDERAALLGQIERLKQGRQPALSAEQKLLHLSLDTSEILLRHCDSSDAAAAALAPLLANHERQVRLAEPDSTFTAGGAPNSKSGGRVGEELVAALSSHAAADLPPPATGAAKGATTGRLSAEDQPDGESCGGSGCPPTVPPAVPEDKENLLPA
ncbi:hypothetical protein BOX15_Mlig025966g3, partial [Macrostomum lignano]